MDAKPTTAGPYSLARYLLAYVALLALAGVSLIFARAVHWERWDLAIDLAVAVSQARWFTCRITARIAS